MIIPTLPIEIHKRVANLHESDLWIDGAWRKKVKLAIKEFQRIEQEYGFNEWRNIKSPKDLPLKRTIEESDKMRIETLNILFLPLRFLFTCSFQHPTTILEHIQTNRFGNYLTKLARKKKQFVYVGELSCPKRYNFPISAIPLRSLYDHQLNKLNGFWQGMAYAREWNKRGKSAKTLKEMGISPTKDHTVEDLGELLNDL